MDVVQLQRQLVDYANSLLTEGLLDAQFKELQSMSDDDNLGTFAAEAVNLYLEQTEKIINYVTYLFEQSTVDFKQISGYAHTMKASSASIGGVKVMDQCIFLREQCEKENIEGCRRCLEQLKIEFFLLRSRLNTLFEIKDQILAVGGSLPKIE